MAAVNLMVDNACTFNEEGSQVYNVSQCVCDVYIHVHACMNVRKYMYIILLCVYVKGGESGKLTTWGQRIITCAFKGLRG